MSITPSDIIIFAVAGIAILLAIMRLLPRIFEGVGAMEHFEDKWEGGMSTGKGLFDITDGGGNR